MSAATEISWDPDWDTLPDTMPHYTLSGRPERLATVTTLHRPAERELAPPLRLTRRGVYVLGAAVAALAFALVAFARVSAPAADAGTHRSVPDTVTVRAGDSLWSIATRLAPGADPQAEVAVLQQLNHLGNAALVPGQVLRTH